jgi:hypothetical protein
VLTSFGNLAFRGVMSLVPHASSNRTALYLNDDNARDSKRYSRQDRDAVNHA